MLQGVCAIVLDKFKGVKKKKKKKTFEDTTPPMLAHSQVQKIVAI